MIQPHFVKPFLNRKCIDYHDDSTCTDNPRMSFALWNRYGYSNISHNRTWYPTPMGFVATQDTQIRCLFPSDASSLTRTNLGCGKWLKDGEPPRNNTETDWCDPFPEDFLTNFQGFYELDRFQHSQPFFMFNFPEYAGCALKPHQKDIMLKAYNAMRQTPFVLQAPGYPWGYGGKKIPTTGAWNEVVVDGAYWNKNAKTNVEAFIIGSRCWDGEMPSCKEQALKVISDYKDMYGFAPATIGFNPHYAEPFYVLEREIEQVLV